MREKSHEWRSKLPYQLQSTSRKEHFKNGHRGTVAYINTHQFMRVGLGLIRKRECRFLLARQCDNNSSTISPTHHTRYRRTDAKTYSINDAWLPFMNRNGTIFSSGDFIDQLSHSYYIHVSSVVVIILSMYCWFAPQFVSGLVEISLNQWTNWVREYEWYWCRKSADCSTNVAQST